MTIEEQQELTRRTEEIISQALGDEEFMRGIYEAMAEDPPERTSLREIQDLERREREARRQS